MEAVESLCCNSEQSKPVVRGREPTNAAQKTGTTAKQQRSKTNSLTTETKSTKVTNSDDATC